MISIKTPYKPAKDPRFKEYRGVKQYYMEKSKDEGKGNLKNQAGTFSMWQT